MKKETTEDEIKYRCRCCGKAIALSTSPLGKFRSKTCATAIERGFRLHTGCRRRHCSHHRLGLSASRCVEFKPTPDDYDPDPDDFGREQQLDAWADSRETSNPFD